MLPIAITMGCPVGIGPELILKFFAQHDGPHDFVVIGDAGVLERTGVELGLPAPVVAWQPGQDVEQGSIAIFSPLPPLAAASLAWGQPSPETGQAMGQWIESAVTIIQQGHLAAMVTCPITKTALNDGGYFFPGHTEMLAELCHASHFAMMMAGSSLRVTLVTIHVALSQVASLVSQESVGEMLDITWQALHDDFALAAPRLAVAGLNPHGGEGAMFGSEEDDIISPAVQAAQDRGLDVKGPFPPDTIFHKAAAGDYDAVVCMYHDQGLIPFKLLHFSDGVNVTLGLPIVRTSVDHGTAYDIAGKGSADPASLLAACKMAGDIVRNRRVL